jgi:tetratricopeptide (TPR) repeat protein
VTLVQAENSYAFGLGKKGKADEAIRQMELLNRMDLTEFVPDASLRSCLQSYLRLPFIRLIWLEGFANVLEAARQPERQIDVWREVFSTSQTMAFLAGEAEAKEKAANLENQLKRTDAALKDYALAGDLYRKLNNEAFLTRVQIPEAILLINAGRGSEAIPIVEQIQSYAKRLNLRELEFRANITLSGIYPPVELSKIRTALETAISLVHPGPFDDTLDNKSVHLAYVSLSDLYRKLEMPTKELLSIHQAFFVSLHLNDKDAQTREVNYLDQRLKDLHIRELVEQRQKEGQVSEALIYTYVLQIRDGTPAKPEEDANWQRVLSLPFQVVQKPGGAADLTEILNNFEPLLKIEKLPMLDALARYYLSTGGDSKLAEKFALEAETLLNGLQGDQTALNVETDCELAVAYARLGKKEAAETKRVECLTLAPKTHDEQLMAYAYAVDGMVHAEAGNIAGAKNSLEKLVAKSPDRPELLVELAISLANAKAYDEANSQLTSAVNKFLSSGDKRAAALAYVRVAIVLDTDSSSTARRLQLKYLNAALNLYHELQSPPDEGNILIALGDYFVTNADPKSAVAEYSKAKDLAQDSQQKNLRAQSLFGLGNAYQNQTEYAKATEAHAAAAALFHELANNNGETMALRNLGRDYYQLNDAEKALPPLLEARRVAKNAAPIHAYFAAYFLGDYYDSQGEYERGLASFRDAAEITAKNGDAEHSAYSHLAIAAVVGFLGDWDDSVSEAELALMLFEKINDKSGQAACWAHLTSVYADRTSSLKDFDKARECYQKALDLGYGKTLGLDLMEIYLQTGKYGEAVKIAKEDIQDCLKANDSNCQAHGLISLSEAERLRGNLKASRAALNEARPLVTQSPQFYLKGRMQYQSSRLLASEGKLDDALSSYEQLITLIENMKGRLAASEQKGIAENYAFIYDEFVALLYSMSTNSAKDQTALASSALKYAEKNKARQFADSWGRVFRNQMAVSLPASLREREQSLYSRRERITAKLEEASTDPSQRSALPTLNSELLGVQKDIEVLLKDLRTASPQYAAIAYPEDISIANLVLRQSETLVELKMTENSTFVWIVQNPDGKKNLLKAFYEVPKQRAWFVDKVSTVRRQLNSARPDAVDLHVCEEMFAALFPGDAAKIIEDSPELLLIPDDALFVLPFELYSPDASRGKFPFLEKPTTYYPSAVSLRLARTARLSPQWQQSFLGIADPITSAQDERYPLVKLQSTQEENGSPAPLAPTDKAGAIPADANKLQSRGYSFERLPGTAAEVQNIASLLKGQKETVDVRIGVDATKSKLLDTDLSKFRFLHFATHGVLAVDTSVQEPSLVLSSDGVDSSHMFLSMSEILGLKLQPESVVLSACNTGSGKISRAEGVMSLGRAFLAAGAESVTVSLWQVSDESTALLMEKYYKGILAHKKKSAALAEARSALFTSGATSPFFWAPFIVIGE